MPELSQIALWCSLMLMLLMVLKARQGGRQ